MKIALYIVVGIVVYAIIGRMIFEYCVSHGIGYSKEQRDFSVAGGWCLVWPVVGVGFAVFFIAAGLIWIPGEGITRALRWNAQRMEKNAPPPPDPALHLNIADENGVLPKLED